MRREHYYYQREPTYAYYSVLIYTHSVALLDTRTQCQIHSRGVSNTCTYDAAAKQVTRRKDAPVTHACPMAAHNTAHGASCEPSTRTRTHTHTHTHQPIIGLHPQVEGPKLAKKSPLFPSGGRYIRLSDKKFEKLLDVEAISSFLLNKKRVCVSKFSEQFRFQDKDRTT